ncbi:acyltransferase family protein [Pseudomonas proteolytica]|uniref:acyltransferase family protein n=1 Tax=Pseudomonas proteolytica TaxID=219574 RepID=UPI0014745D3F|nr:acyltransferase family protein [Pseudomonas proteolytica]NMZ34918.1 acyltransferase [Pseudomonas proteolytica]
MEFRKDINGLRAVAVLAVVLFHFGVPGASGGFVGVDIFFVISGFLMSGIIFSKIEKGDFSVWLFYLDRCRRIVPALSVVAITVLVVGYFLLIPEELSTLGKHVASSLFFLSNFVFWRESGYFDLASHEKWMLHTWSLSVEWQFYIIYPLLILCLQKFFGFNKSRFVIVAGAILSFIVSVYASGSWPGAAFYLLPTRAWEMLAGALVYLFPITLEKRHGHWLEIFGLSLIVVSIIFFDSQTVWPGWPALVPVIGAVLIIYSSQSDSLVTCNRGAQFFGKASYSIYLWHWPFAVFMNYWGLKGQAFWVIACIVFSIFFGYLSYRLVEGAASKNAKKTFGVPPLGKIFIFSGLAGVMASVASFSDGFPDRMGARFDKQTKDLVMPLPDNGWCFYGVDSSRDLVVGDKGLKCIVGNRGAGVKGLLFGDSYAGHNVPFWDVLGKELSIEVNTVSTNWCFPSVGAEFTGPTSSRAYLQCLINRKYLQDSLSGYDVIVFSGSWGSVYEQSKMKEIHDVVALAASQTKLVILMAAPTAYDANVKYRYERSLLLGNRFDISTLPKTKDVVVLKANDEVKNMAENYGNVVYLSRDSLFNVEGKPSDVTAKNIPYSFDGGHISVYGSIMSARAFKGTPSYEVLRRRVAEIE